MSSVRIDIANVVISSDEIVKKIISSQRYGDYSDDDVKAIVLGVIQIYKKALKSDDKVKTIDDEQLFDEAYDFILKRMDEMFSTSDIAYLVNDVLSYLEDKFYDMGLLEYET